MKDNNQVVFSVNGRLPRTCPYKKFRSRLYVPADVRAWRKRIADTFLKAGGRRPRLNEHVSVVALFRFSSKDHADVDSIYHSLQDALSKDALHCADKQWGHLADFGPFVTPKKEGVDIMVTYERRP